MENKEHEPNNGNSNIDTPSKDSTTKKTDPSISKNKLKKLKREENLVELKKEMRIKTKEKRKEKEKKEKDEMNAKLNEMTLEERKSFFDELANQKKAVEVNFNSDFRGIYS